VQFLQIYVITLELSVEENALKNISIAVEILGVLQDYTMYIWKSLFLMFLLDIITLVGFISNAIYLAQFSFYTI